MKVQCPKCARTLALADEFAGRRVKCPGCQEVFRTPASEGVAIAPLLNAVPADAPVVRPPADLPSDAVQQVASPPKPTRPVCPECGEKLVAGGSECPECGWTSGRPVRGGSRRAAAAEGVGGGCYVFIRKDEVDLIEAIEKRMKKLLETEQIDIPIMGEYDQPPDELGPDDIVISGKIVRCDYGSQVMRYLIGIVAAFGPGSSQLEVDVEVDTAQGGVRRIKAKSRLWMGIFGGGNTGLMKQNVKVIATRIANGAARHATGRRFLNIQAYRCGYWSLGLGLASLIPFGGVPFGLIALVLGIVALVTIKRRQLPRGKGVALAGIILSFVGFLVTAGMVVLMANG